MSATHMGRTVSGYPRRSRASHFNDSVFSRSMNESKSNSLVTCTPFFRSLKHRCGFRRLRQTQCAVRNGVPVGFDSRPLTANLDYQEPRLPRTRAVKARLPKLGLPKGRSRLAPSASVSPKAVGECVRQEGGQGYREGGRDVGEGHARQGLACVARLSAAAQCDVAGNDPRYGGKRGENEEEERRYCSRKYARNRSEAQKAECRRRRCKGISRGGRLGAFANRRPRGLTLRKPALLGNGGNLLGSGITLFSGGIGSLG